MSEREQVDVRREDNVWRVFVRETVVAECRQREWADGVAMIARLSMATDDALEMARTLVAKSRAKRRRLENPASATDLHAAATCDMLDAIWASLEALHARGGNGSAR